MLFSEEGSDIPWSWERHSADPAKTQKIQDYPVPTDLTKLRQFLGLASYYRGFIHGFAKVSHPFYHLMKKGVAFEWDTACQTALNMLKELLTTAPVLNLVLVPSLFWKLMQVRLDLVLF